MVKKVRGMMGYLKGWMSALRFEEERSLKWSALYAIGMAFLQAALSLPFASTFYQKWSDIMFTALGKGLPQIQLTTTGYAIILLVMYLVFIVLIALIAAIVHLLYKIFGGSREGFSCTAQAICYGLTPTFLLAWIPAVSLYTYPLSFVHCAYGLYKTHDIPRWKHALLMIAIALLFASIVLYILGY